jgi:hypothetical protein
MDKVIDKFKQAWDENPLAVIAIGSFAVVAAARIINATTEARNSHTWKKEVDRRIMMKSSLT